MAGMVLSAKSFYLAGNVGMFWAFKVPLFYSDSINTHTRLSTDSAVTVRIDSGLSKQ